MGKKLHKDIPSELDGESGARPVLRDPGQPPGSPSLRYLLPHHREGVFQRITHNDKYSIKKVK